MEDGKVMIKLNVLYEDNHIIVVEKPSGMLSQADQTGDLDLLSSSGLITLTNIVSRAGAVSIPSLNTGRFYILRLFT